jgi:argininosuccinate lyase
MGVADKMWDAITTVIKMNDRVERMAATMKTQQEKIEGLTERIIRIETALEIALVSRGVKKPAARRIDHKNGSGEG